MLDDDEDKKVEEPKFEEISPSSLNPQSQQEEQ
jgi:hypothetical protein